MSHTVTDNLIIELQDKIKKLESQNKTLEGKALAAARDSAQSSRNAAQSIRDAQVYREETDAVIMGAADQLKIAWTIGHFVYLFGQMHMRIAARIDTAARLVHREATLIDAIKNFIDAQKAENGTLMAAAAREGETYVNIFNSTSEKQKLELNQTLLVLAHQAAKQDIEKIVDQLRASYV